MTTHSPATVGTRAAAVMQPADYQRMVHPAALALVPDFMTEEAMVLESVATSFTGSEQASLVVVGGAASQHLDAVAARFASYVVVDPIARPGGPDRIGMRTVTRLLQEVGPGDLPDGPTVWVFTFNVYPYLDGPLRTLRPFVSPGDVAVITSWAATPSAEPMRARYLRHVFAPGTLQEFAADATTDLGAVRRDLAAAGLGAEVEFVAGEVIDSIIVRFSSANPGA